MKAFKLLALTSCVLLAAGNGVAQQNYSKSEGLLQYVDPYIGSGYHGHVFVGTSVPYGMVQLGPTNIHKGWDWCSGYHYSDSILIGFSHTHLSGTGCTDLCDILIMPLNEIRTPEAIRMIYVMGMLPDILMRMKSPVPNITLCFSTVTISKPS